MAQESTTTWKQQGMLFEGDIDGFKLTIDGDKKDSFSPKPLLLVSLGGCTGIDVVSILQKMRVEFEDLEVKVSGTLTEEHPKVYDKIHVEYVLKGQNIDSEKVEKAIHLSKTKYCGVSAMLSKAAEVTHSVTYIK